MRPSGKLPPGVYWRRRLIVLTVVLLVIWLFFRVVGGGDDDPSSAEPPASTPTATTAPTEAPPTQAPKNRKAKDVKVDVRLAPVGGACPPESVYVTPSVPAGSYAGRTVPVTLRVFSTAASACTVRIDPSTFVLNVSDADGTLWDTQECDTLEGRTVDVHPSWATVIEVSWDGRANGDSCDDKGDQVKPGAYTAQAALLGGEPATARFSLVKAPPPPKPTKPTATPTKPTATPTKPTATPTKPTPTKPTPTS